MPSHDGQRWNMFDICWAKCEGYPFWPGVIVELRSERRLACVAFYGESGDVNEATWFVTDEDALRPYAANRQQ